MRHFLFLSWVWICAATSFRREAIYIPILSVDAPYYGTFCIITALSYLFIIIIYDNIILTVAVCLIFRSLGSFGWSVFAEFSQLGSLGW